jgi:hypothetical protein
MTPKSRGLIAIDPGVKLKKTNSLNKIPIAKCQNFRGQVEISHISQVKTASFMKLLFITVFLIQGMPIQKLLQIMGHVPHDALQTPQFSLKHAWTDVTPKIIIHVLWLYKSQRKNDTGGEQKI